MIYTKSVVGRGVNVLAADVYRAIPMCCHGRAVMKAGTPVTSAGIAALDGSSAIGILLYDVDPTDNPVGSVVVNGVIDYGKAKSNAGITATAAALSAIMPAIHFRTDIGAGEEEEMAKLLYVPFLVEETEGDIVISTTANYAEVRQAINEDYAVIAKVSVANEEILIFAQLVGVYGTQDEGAIAFSFLQNTASEGEPPKPFLNTILFTADACAFESVELAVNE